jgi:hypothetical protein
MPLTAMCVRPFDRYAVGVPQVGTSVRDTRHFSAPVGTSNAARNDPSARRLDHDDAVFDDR